jgi:hypothetical protein
VKLVLDEHYAPRVAEQLRQRGYDVIAAAENVELRELPDEQLLYWAREERRVLVTENVGDFMPLHHASLSRGEVHAGMLFTSPRRFPRRMAAVGLLITALAGFIDERPDVAVLEGQIAWL